MERYAFGMHRDKNGAKPATPAPAVPHWKKRRWELFKRFINTPEMRKHIRASHLQVAGKKPTPIAVLVPFITSEVPEGCDVAYEYLLQMPGVTDQELVDLIESPVKYICHPSKVMGPSKDPDKTYARHMRGFRIMMEHCDMLWEAEEKLLNYDYGLYLKIDPYTTQKEITSFVEANHDKYLRPLLEKQSVFSNKQPEQITKQNAKVRSTSVEVTARLVELKEQGCTVLEMIDIIADEFGKFYDPAAIYKRISRAKSRKKI